MDKTKLLDIIKNLDETPNKDLIQSRKDLMDEFNSTKELIISLTRHLESIEELYKKVDKEIIKRNIR